ncbi:hypothetical protein [Streptacidiphilus sp. PAMC 29251]
MATATEPTVRPDPTPADPATVAPQAGPLARILTPVEPARPVTPLGTTASMGQEAEAASSTAKDSTGQGTSRDGAVTALVRALASRLARTGTTTKRSHEVKETRVSGATSTSANKSDRLAKHDGQHRTARDAKTADLNNKQSQQHRRHNGDVKKADTSDRKTADTKAAKADTASRDNKDLKKGNSSDAKTSSAKTAKADTASKRDDKADRSAPAAKAADIKAPNDRAQKDATAGPPKPTGTVNDPKGLGAKIAAAKAPDPKTGAKAGPDTDSTKAVPKADSKSSPASTAKATPEATGRPPLRTQPAREAGYRQGTKVAATAGKVEAYRDGAKDGWDDQRAADHAEAKQMDEARTRNAIKPQKVQPELKPASGSTADMTKQPAPAAAQESKKTAPETSAASTPPVAVSEREKPMTPTKPAPTTAAVPPKAQAAPTAAPVRVNAVGAKSVSFTGADGVQHVMGRGEIRTLRQFERRLSEDATRLARIEEATRETQAHAELLFTRANRLFEEAKAVKGGVTLSMVLLRLAERAKVLHGRAQEVQRNAQRSTEAVKVLSANANTRHGGIYKAVVDSPLTIPAERAFYQDKQGS